MIEKALLSGLWARPVGCWCPFIISHISSCFTVRFTFLFTALVATRLCRCFASKWLYVSCYALTAAPCDLGDPGWGDPWFPHGGFLLCSPWGMALWFRCSSVCFCCHTISRWYNVITLALISPWTGTCHASVRLFCLGFCVLLWFGGFAFGFCFLVCGDFVTAYWTLRRSYTSSLLRPLNLQTAMHALID